jgi:cysteine desulfurase / selenocysteine lyase
VELNKVLPMFNVEQVRADFPILNRKVHGQPLVYLDSAATALKPSKVIDRVAEYYRMETANVHRAGHFLAERGTVAYEGARGIVKQFINAGADHEIIFTRGTTESINLVAQAYGRKFLNAGDEIILSELEHHSNIVPWQLIAEEKGCKIRVIPLLDSGDLDFESFQNLLSGKTKIVALTACSNVLGAVIPLKKFIQAAHQVGAKVLVDAAQGVTQGQLDVQALDCDFLAFSGHKLFGPFGIGVLYGKTELLESMPPYQGGGSMIGQVSWENTTWAALPHKFEAGTPSIADAIGLGEAIRYVEALGFEAIQAHEHDLLTYAHKKLAEIPGLVFYGPQSASVGAHAPILSFNIQGVHASDLGALLDQQGVAIRAGHHCCQPLMKRLGVPATARVSFSIYNTRQEVDVLKGALLKAKEILL